MQKADIHAPRKEARIRKARIVRGEYYDAIKMGILREEWENTL